MHDPDPLKPIAFRPVWFDWPQVKRLVGVLEKAGIRFLFFGGALRDAVHGVYTPSDIDVVASATPEDIKACFDAEGIAARVGGYGKVVVTIDHFMFDIIPWIDPAFADSDEQVVRSAIRNKAIYSDFSINSLFLSPQGELYDFFGGIQDLLAGCIHFNIDPKDSIALKPPEILRYFRFHAWYGKQEPDAYTVATCETLARLLPESIVGNPTNKFYIHREMARLLAAPRPYATIATMHEHGILDFACGFPVASIKPLRALESLEMLHHGASDYTIRLAALILGSALGPMAALEKAADFLSLPDNVKLKLRTIIGLLAYVGTPMPPVMQYMLQHAAGERGFDILMMLHSAREHSLATTHRTFDWLTARHDACDYDAMPIPYACYLQQPQMAFTLFEMSLVLVIIGLVASSILVGKELIHQSELRSIVTQMERYNTAANAFRLKYNCLPGDCAFAASIGVVTPGHAAIGDGNGMIGVYSMGLAGPFETSDFWEHLANAQLVKDPIASIMHGAGSMVTAWGNPALKMRAVSPSVSQQASIGVFPGHYLSTSLEPVPQVPRDGHYLWVTSSGIAAMPGSAALAPSDAAAVDSKIDDGMPLGGGMQAVGDFVSSNYGPTITNNGVLPFAGAAGSASCVNNSVVPSQYNMTASASGGDCIGAANCSRCGIIAKTTF